MSHPHVLPGSLEIKGKPEQEQILAGWSSCGGVSTDGFCLQIQVCILGFPYHGKILWRQAVLTGKLFICFFKLSNLQSFNWNLILTYFPTLGGSYSSLLKPRENQWQKSSLGVYCFEEGTRLSCRRTLTTSQGQKQISTVCGSSMLQMESPGGGSLGRAPPTLRWSLQCS